MHWRRSLAFLAFCGLLALSGCWGGAAPAAGSDSEVKKVGIVFMRFLGSHQGKTPANREEFEKYLAELTPADLKTMGINSPSEVLRSSRDGEDLVIRYGIVVPPPGKDPTVVAYEQKGVGGKHMVVYGTAGVEEITAARLKELVPDAK